MVKYTVTKRFDGYSACFRQWRAEGTHCKYLHGYGIYFDVVFEGELDERNWVWDFGGMKRAKARIDDMIPTDWFKWLLDHTTLVAEDDPHIKEFQRLHELGIIQLRVVPAVGCERFAQLLLSAINDFLLEETKGRVVASKVTVYEHDRNSASCQFI